MDSQKTLLIAVMDWGLGHATRSSELIHELKALGHRLIIASSGRSKLWLSNKFPDLHILEKPGYNVHYPATGNISLAIIFQQSRLSKTIQEELQWTDSLIATNPIDGIISDCCFGVRSQTVPTVLITHQLNLRVHPLLKSMAQRILDKQLMAFNSIWVPDGHHHEASGLLSRWHKSVDHIGHLSQFNPNVPSIENDVLALLSGPEPRRSQMQKAWTEALSETQEKVIFFGGDEHRESKSKENITFKAWDDPDLNGLLLGARKIVCNAGYSTLMDLIKLQRTAVLVPTKGQAEQEYLAKFWKENYGYKVVKEVPQLYLENGPSISLVPEQDRRTGTSSSSNTIAKAPTYTPLKIMIIQAWLTKL